MLSSRRNPESGSYNGTRQLVGEPSQVVDLLASHHPDLFKDYTEKGRVVCRASTDNIIGALLLALYREEIAAASRTARAILTVQHPVIQEQGPLLYYDRVYQPLGSLHHMLWTPESLGVVNYGPATGLLVYRSRRVTYDHGVTSRYWNSDPFDPHKVYGVFCHSTQDEEANPDAAKGEYTFRQILERYRDMDTGQLLPSLCESLGYPFDNENFHRTVIPR